MEKVSAKKATLWSFFERFSTQGVAFIIGIILARLLTPHDYGVVGLMSIFLMLSNVFIDSGFGNAIIRKENIQDQDLSTAFIFNTGVGVSIYLVLVISSPYIALYFDEPILGVLVKIAGFNVVLNSICIVPVALLTAKLNIRIQAVASVISQLIAGILAIYLAFKGYGVYALVVQTVVSNIIKSVILWGAIKWRPTINFSMPSLSYLWNFGSKLLAANLIGTIFNEIYSVLIGKYIGKDDLGYYSKSSQLNNSINNVNGGVIQKVCLPLLSRYQNDTNLLRENFRYVMKLLVFYTAPLASVLCFTSRDIVTIIWTEKWIESAYMFSVLITASIWIPISSLSLMLLQVVNRTDLILKLEFPKKTIFAILIGVGFMFGVKGLVYVQIVINIIAALINMYPTKKILNYSYSYQLMDLLKYMVVAYTIGYVLSLIVLISNVWAHFMIFSIFYLSLYAGVLYLIRDENVLSLYGLMKKRLSR